MKWAIDKKTIEENQLKIIRKIEEGEVKVKLEKNLDFENDFRDVTSTEDMSIRQEDNKGFIENLGNHIDYENKEAKLIKSDWVQPRVIYYSCHNEINRTHFGDTLRSNNS